MSVKRREDEEEGGEVDIKNARVDPEDMGCGQRCFFTYGQMCQRISEALNCCMTDYEEAMQKERRWEETVRLKERVLKQRDHLVRLEKEQKQLMDRMIDFQTETTELIEETGENVRKELKKAFRMEVDISTKELMRKHEHLAKEQNGMAEDIEEHQLKLQELEGRTDKIKRELNETFVQLQEVDEELKHEEVKTKERFADTHNKMNEEHEEINHKLDDNVKTVEHVKHNLHEQDEMNQDQNKDLMRIKRALEALRVEQQKKPEAAGPQLGGFGFGAPSIDDIDGEIEIGSDGEPLPPKPKPRRPSGIAGKMKMFLGAEPEFELEELEEGDLPDVPEEEPEELPEFYEYMIHTPSEGETPSEAAMREEKNAGIINDKIVEVKAEKRKFKKRAKRKKIAVEQKQLKKKNTKASAGGGGTGLPTHVTNA